MGARRLICSSATSPTSSTPALHLPVPIEILPHSIFPSTSATITFLPKLQSHPRPAPASGFFHTTTREGHLSGSERPYLESGAVLPIHSGDWVGVASQRSAVRRLLHSSSRVSLSSLDWDPVCPSSSVWVGLCPLFGFWSFVLLVTPVLSFFRQLFLPGT